MNYLQFINENRNVLERSLKTLSKKYIDMGCEVEIALRYYDSIYLTLIKIPDSLKGRGIATQFMDDLIKWADERSFVITLSPTDNMGSDLPRLIEFYQRFGFIKNRHNYKDSKWVGEMIRFPK